MNCLKRLNLIGACLAAWLLCGLLSAAQGAEATTEPDAAVTSGRKAMAGAGQAPWYDAANDALAPVELRHRRETKIPQWLSNVLQWAAWALLVILLIALAVFLLRSALGRDSSPKDAARQKDVVLAADRVEALTFMATRNRDDLLGEARRHYEAGNYSEAIIYLFSYELVQLDKSSLIHLAKGKTNRQYLRELARKGPLAGLLERTTGTFEDVFFGRRALDRSGFEACWNQLPEFEGMLAQVNT